MVEYLMNDSFIAKCPADCGSEKILKIGQHL